MPPPLLRAARCGPAPAHTRLICGAQRALLPVAVGTMNIHDVCDRHQTDVRQKHRLMPPISGGGIISLLILGSKGRGSGLGADLRLQRVHIASSCLLLLIHVLNCLFCA